MLWQLVVFKELAETCMYMFFRFASASTSLSARNQAKYCTRLAAEPIADEHSFQITVFPYDTKPPLYAQDPVFNATDKDFLSFLDITVLEDPHAFDKIDEQAYSYAPHYPVAAWPTQMRLGLAALVIGNDVEAALSR